MPYGQWGYSGEEPDPAKGPLSCALEHAQHCLDEVRTDFANMQGTMHTAEGTALSIDTMQDHMRRTSQLEELVMEFDEVAEDDFDPETASALSEQTQTFFAETSGFDVKPDSFSAETLHAFRTLHATLKVILRKRQEEEKTMQQRRPALGRNIREQMNYVQSAESTLRSSLRELLQKLDGLKTGIPEMREEIGAHTERLHRALTAEDSLDFDEDLLRGIQHTLSLIENCLAGIGPR